MDDLKVCRICLRIDKFAKYYKLGEFSLKSYYEEITATPLTDDDRLPKYFCYQCSAILNNYHYFKEKCCFAQKTLKQMAMTAPLTYNKICNMYSRQMPIIKRGNVEILKINKRVKTYNLVYGESATDAIAKAEQEEKEEIEDTDSDCYEMDVNFIVQDDNNSSEDEMPITELSSELKKEDNNIDIFLELEKDKDLNTPILDDVIIPNPPEVERVVEQKLKTKQSKPSKKPKSVKPRQNKKRAAKKKEEYSDSDDDVLANKKKTNVLQREYKFHKPRPRVLRFLDSGFWRKSNLTDEEALAAFQAKAQERKYLKAAYKCTDCFRGFSQKSMLDRHMPLKHGEDVGNLICRFCKCRFRTGYFLNKHMRLHYTKFECLRCNLVCNLDKSALFHEEYHSGVIRKCPHCDKEFKHMSTFYTHLRTHRSKYMCPRCGESFVSELGLYLHQKVKHITESQNVEDDNSTYCEVCKIKFDTIEAYDKHLLHSAMHTEDKTLQADTAMKESMNEDGDMEHLKGEIIDTSTLYTRKTRVEKNLSAVRKRNLNAMPTKVARKPTTCHHCGKHFETQSACMKHHHAEHPRKSFYAPKDRVICEVCGASLAPSSVPAHLNQHTRQKMYTCDTCGRSFTTNNMLRNHIVTHTGERKHACSICGKRFAQSGSLSLHHRTVHLKLPYPRRNRRKRVEEPNTEAGPFGAKDDYRVWRHYFDSSTYTNS